MLYRLSYMSAILLTLERVAGIEPAYSAWKADVLPLNYTRWSYSQNHSSMAWDSGLTQPTRLTTYIVSAFGSAPAGHGIFRRSYGSSSASDPHSRTSHHVRLFKHGGGGWIRTTEARASDLQSDPFGHSGTPPKGGILS